MARRCACCRTRTERKGQGTRGRGQGTKDEGARTKVMSEHRDEQQRIARTHNTARFFTETRHVAWVLLIGTVLWGIYGYVSMPQRKDPDVQVRQALAMVPWPGASAEKIEQLVTRRIEEKIDENVRVEKIE